MTGQARDEEEEEEEYKTGKVAYLEEKNYI